MDRLTTKKGEKRERDTWKRESWVTKVCTFLVFSILNSSAASPLAPTLAFPQTRWLASASPSPSSRGGREKVGQREVALLLRLAPLKDQCLGRLRRGRERIRLTLGPLKTLKQFQ